MKIIVLDDSPEELEAFNSLLKEYYPKNEICLTDSLVDFHEFLFNSIKDTPYDKIIIDAQLEKPNDLDERYYYDFLKKVNIDDKSIADNDHLGWKYYEYYLRKKLPRKFLRNVLIKTGFSRSVHNFASQTKNKVNILNKGDPDYFNKLKEYLNN